MAAPSQSDAEFLAQARRDFEADRTFWSELKEQANRDLRAINVLGGQWKKDVKSDREGSGTPALEFNELHTYVQRCVNQAREERPQPKVTPGDDEANEETAEVLESRLRHIQYASQADVAYDCAVEAALSGGFGFYRVNKEYVDDTSFDQEPRIRRILDCMTVTFDKNCQEPDFSDAKRCWIRQKMSRDEYREEFGQEPVDWSDSQADMGAWCDGKDDVYIAEYWHVESKKRYRVQYDGGATDTLDTLPDPSKASAQDSRGLPITHREIVERSIRCDLIDGARILHRSDWEGAWIPIIPVLGREVVVEGQKYLISMVRFALDAQKLKNTFKSGVAGTLQLASRAPWLGITGQFRDAKWRDAHLTNYAYLEYDAVPLANGQVAPPPTRNTAEAPIQALSISAAQVSDEIKRAVGYTDAINRPSQSDLSGVAVQRRSQQAELTNYHFEDNLERSQWHCARVVLDLDIKLSKTNAPRAVGTAAEDGSVKMIPVTSPQEDGTIPEVPGYEGAQHHRFDLGKYNVAVISGPGYATKSQEEKDFLLQIVQANPGLFPLYADIIFKKLGYSDLEERAQLALPPPIQQAMQSKQQGIPPQMQQQIAMLSQQNQQLKAEMQGLLLEKKAKLVETQGRLEVERLKTAGQIVVQQAKHHDDHASRMLEAELTAIDKTLGMLHESELSPPPGIPGQPPHGQ